MPQALFDVSSNTIGAPTSSATFMPFRRGQGDLEAARKKATTATAQGAALNDNAKGGIDRFGFMAYAIAIARILRGNCFPMCVGLFAR